MALITCPECSKQVSDQASSCPSCGYPIKQEEEDVFDFNDYSESSNYAKTTLGVLAGYNLTPEVSALIVVNVVVLLLSVIKGKRALVEQRRQELF